MRLPLDDLRVVSIEQYGAGPFGSMQLADLGADVVKVEDPTVGGDVARQVPPYAAEGTSFLKHVNPRLVCASRSAFGNTDPRAPHGGYDDQRIESLFASGLVGSPERMETS
jgi:crotonobetainyl-CoA:carnitine CoA-transferase CaiB-like acyl-CoA transferase